MDIEGDEKPEARRGRSKEKQTIKAKRDQPPTPSTTGARKRKIYNPRDEAIKPKSIAKKKPDTSKKNYSPSRPTSDSSHKDSEKNQGHNKNL